MKNKIFLILLILTCLFPTLSAYSQTKENPPIIHFAYAQENIRQGDVWKIYLSVSDPSNNIARIVCRIKQDGGPIKPLPSDLEKALNQRLGTIDVEFVGD